MIPRDWFYGDPCFVAEEAKGTGSLDGFPKVTQQILEQKLMSVPGAPRVPSLDQDVAPGPPRHLPES